MSQSCQCPGFNLDQLHPTLHASKASYLSAGELEITISNIISCHIIQIWFQGAVSADGKRDICKQYLSLVNVKVYAWTRLQLTTWTLCTSNLKASYLSAGAAITKMIRVYQFSICFIYVLRLYLHWLHRRKVWIFAINLIQYYSIGHSAHAAYYYYAYWIQKLDRKCCLSNHLLHAPHG